METTLNLRRLLIAATLLIMIGLSAHSAGLAQGHSDLARLRALNSSLLNIHSQITTAKGFNAPSLSRRAEPVIAERYVLLQSLVKQDPAAALASAFDASTLESMIAAFPESADQFESHGSWSGPVETIIFDDPSLSRHRVEVTMRTADGTLRLHFDDPEPTWFQSNDTLDISGLRVGADVAVASRIQARPTPGPSCPTVGDQKTVVILIQYPDDPATTTVNEEALLPAETTNSLVHDIYFQTGGRSVDGYWREASYGKTSASGVVIGPVWVDRVYACNETGAMRQAAINAADSQVDFTQYTRLMVIFPLEDSCTWGGMGTFGCSTLSSADGGFLASTSWNGARWMTNIDNGVKLGAHEAGHNLKLYHANTRTFTNATTGLFEPLGPVGAAGTNTEYGDNFSIMGRFFNHGHYAAPHKQMLGWFNPGNVQTVEGSGSFSIEPFENVTGGVQALKVRRGTGNDAWMWLEFRQDIGIYDSTLNSHGKSGALIHHADANTGSNTLLLDFTPETGNNFADAAKLPGTGVWVDPYSNLTLSVDSITGVAPASALNVTVSYVAPTTTLSPIGGPFAPRALVNMVATSSISASGNSVVFTMVKPNGTTTKTVSADVTGIATWSYRLSTKDPNGTYRVTARTTFGGQQGPASSEQTFVVQ